MAHSTTKEQPLWKMTVEGALIGLAGAAAMFATELLLFPDLAGAQRSAMPQAAGYASGQAVAFPFTGTFVESSR